jgi:hypothetical protein
MNRLKLPRFMQWRWSDPRLLRFIAVSAVALADGSGISIAVADTPPTPPGQPSTGPGGSDYVHRTVKKCGLLGEGARAFHLYEPSGPAPATAPVIVFLHGYLGVNPVAYGAWIEHLVRRGNIVVFPVYQDSLIGAERYTTTRLRQCARPSESCRAKRAMCVPTRKVTGRSSGILSVARSRRISPRKPQPRTCSLRARSWPAIPAMPIRSSKTSRAFCAHRKKIPDLLLLVVVGKDDLFAKETTGRAIFEKSIGLKSENKNLIRLRSDRSGHPPLSADHFSPLALNQSYDSGKSLRGGDRERRSPGSRAHDATDALDYFGYWKWFDALTDAAFFGRNRNIALGDTPEQRFMGKWSDGTPIVEPDVELAK